MKTIKAVPISAEEFAPFGQFYNNQELGFAFLIPN